MRSWSLASTTLRAVACASSSTRWLFSPRDRCCTSSRARLASPGIRRTRAENASSPPAEAPTAATRKWGAFERGSCASSDGGEALFPFARCDCPRAGPAEGRGRSLRPVSSFRRRVFILSGLTMPPKPSSRQGVSTTLEQSAERGDVVLDPLPFAAVPLAHVVREGGSLDQPLEQHHLLLQRADRRPEGDLHVLVLPLEQGLHPEGVAGVAGEEGRLPVVRLPQDAVAARARDRDQRAWPGRVPV